MRGHAAAPGRGEDQVSIHIEDLSHEKTEYVDNSGQKTEYVDNFGQTEYVDNFGQTEYVDNSGQLQLLSQVRLSAGHGRRLQNIYSQPHGYRDKL